MVASFHETQSKRKNKRGLPDHLWVLQRALEGRSGRTERSKGAQGRIMHQRPKNRGALNTPRDERPNGRPFDRTNVGAQNITKEPTRSAGTATSPALTCSIGRRSRPYATVVTARPVPITPCLGPGQSESKIPQFWAPLMGLSGGRGPLFTGRYYKYWAPGGAIFGLRERPLLHPDGGGLRSVSRRMIG